jgi:hypothetical protein
MPDEKKSSDDPSLSDKDAFRAALERKRGQQHARNAEAQADSKIHGSQSSGGGKRTFRRKSGG